MVAAELLSKEGYKIVAVSDSKGGIYDSKGLDIKKVVAEKKKSRTVTNYNAKKISNEDINNLNRFVVEINKELAMMYTLMPDKKYSVLKDKFLIGKNTLNDQKESLLVAMRLSQFPKTKFSKREDIRKIYKLKKEN